MRSVRMIVMIVLACAGVLPQGPCLGANDLTTREGTIPFLVAHAGELIGTDVELDSMMVVAVSSDHLLLREPLSAKDTILVQAATRDTKRYQTVLARGVLARDSAGDLYLADAHVYAYVDGNDEIIYFPLPKAYFPISYAFATVEVTVGSTEPLAAPDVQHSAATMLDSISSPVSGTPLAALKLLPDDTEVEVRSKWVAGVDLLGTAGWLEEADRSAAIRAEGIYALGN